MDQPPRTLLHRRTLLAISVFGVITGGLILGHAVTSDSDCGQGQWPAFAITFAAIQDGDPIGLIEWCDQDNWSIRALNDAAPAWLSDRESSDRDRELFGWFNESLTLNEAWAKADRRIPTVVEPRHPEATDALAVDTPLGSAQMDFSPEGIPLLFERSGGGVQIWATRLDRVDRPIRSDDEIFDRPMCFRPLAAGETRRRTTCWTEMGMVRDRSGCLGRFDRPIDTFSDPACTL